MTKDQFALVLEQAFVKLADWDEDQRSRIMVPMGNPQAAFMDEPWDGETVCGIPVKSDELVPAGTAVLVKDNEPVAVIYNIGPAKEQG